MKKLSEERVFELKEAAFNQGTKVYEIIPAEEMAAYKVNCLERLEELLEKLPKYRMLKRVRMARAEMAELEETIAHIGLYLWKKEKGI